MAQDIKDLLDQITHHETMAEHHAATASSLRSQYQTLLGDSPVDWGRASAKRRPTKSYKRWIGWLTANGPAARKTIADEVGLLTGEVPPYADALGLSPSQLQDAAYPEDTMMRLSAENEHGHGRPVDVYFLWSQRWDVHPLFGVGPIKPEPDESDATQDDLQEMWDSDPSIIAGPITIIGVIQPPVSSHPIDPAYGDEQPIDWSPDPTRYVTMAEWDDAWESQFDLYVATETKPTDEEKQTLYDTLPDGADRNAALAIGYRAAVERSRMVGGDDG